MWCNAGHAGLMTSRPTTQKDATANRKAPPTEVPNQDGKGGKKAKTQKAAKQRSSSHPRGEPSQECV